MKKSILSFVIFVATWIAIGLIGQNVMEIKSFPYVMGWGVITASISYLVSESTANYFKWSGKKEQS